MPTVIDDLPVKLVRAALCQQTNRALAQHWGVSITTIVRWRKRLGVTRDKRRFPAPRRQRVVAVLAAHPQGLRLSELARTQEVTSQATATSLKYAARVGIVHKHEGRWMLTRTEGQSCVIL